MDKEELYDLIDRSLREELTPAETEQVNELIQTDHELAREFLLHEEIHFAVADTGLLDFKKKLKNADKIYSQENSGQVEKKGISFFLKLAASVTVIVGISAALYFSKTDAVNNKDLYESYFTPYEAPVNFRSGNSPYLDEEWKQALFYYDKGKYKESLPYFNRVVANKPANKLARLLRGVSYLASGSTTQAEQDFKTLMKDQNNMFVEQATWYLALCYLKQGQLKEAKHELEELGRRNSKYSVRELQNKLP